MTAPFVHLVVPTGGREHLWAPWCGAGGVWVTHELGKAVIEDHMATLDLERVTCIPCFRAAASEAIQLRAHIQDLLAAGDALANNIGTLTKPRVEYANEWRRVRKGK